MAKDAFHALRRAADGNLYYSFWDYGEDEVHRMLSTALELSTDKAIERHGSIYTINGVTVGEVRPGDGFERPRKGTK